MKIAITGHTSGLGEKIFELLQEKGHQCVGLSRSTGHNIESDRSAIVEAVMDCDVFVNNAYSGFSQTELLYELWQCWKDFDRTIVNISSRSGDSPAAALSAYKVHKRSLSDTCHQLQKTGTRCRVICVRPSLIDTPMTAAKKQAKLSPDEVANVVSWLLDLPTHLLVVDIGLVYHQ